MTMKGILLAGGRGTRLYPLTRVTSKQLQPIYNKPMLYYPLTTMILAGVREILIITTPEDVERFRSLLGDGAPWGVSLSYATQDEPRGIAEALLIGEAFLGDAAAFLMLGDNFIYGRLDFLRDAITRHTGGATIFAYQVADPRGYGVVEFGADFVARSIEEKPARPRSNWAVPGMYLYSGGVADRVRGMAPSGRGELEITDLNRTYLEEGTLKVKPMGRGIAWLDTGTPENLLNASNFVHAIESRQGLVIGSPEEAAWRAGFLSDQAFVALTDAMPASEYRDCLRRLCAEATPA